MTRGPSLIGTKPIYSQTLSRVQLFETPSARILEWVAIFLFRGSSQPRDQTSVSCIGRWILYHRATREATKPRSESFCALVGET